MEQPQPEQLSEQKFWGIVKAVAGDPVNEKIFLQSLDARDDEAVETYRRAARLSADPQWMAYTGCSKRKSRSTSALLEENSLGHPRRV